MGTLAVSEHSRRLHSSHKQKDDESLRLISIPTFSWICPFLRCLIHAASLGFSSPLPPPRNLCANIINKSSITLDTRFG